MVDADKLMIDKATGIAIHTHAVVVHFAVFPQSVFFCYSSEEKQPQHHLCAKILHCYEPQTPGELRLHQVGEIIIEVASLEHGWCKVCMCK